MELRPMAQRMVRERRTLPPDVGKNNQIPVNSKHGSKALAMTSDATLG